MQLHRHVAPWVECTTNAAAAVSTAVGTAVSMAVGTAVSTAVGTAISTGCEYSSKYRLLVQQ